MKEVCNIYICIYISLTFYNSTEDILTAMCYASHVIKLMHNYLDIVALNNFGSKQKCYKCHTQFWQIIPLNHTNILDNLHGLFTLWPAPLAAFVWSTCCCVVFMIRERVTSNLLFTTACLWFPSFLIYRSSHTCSCSHTSRNLQYYMYVKHLLRVQTVYK